MVLPTNLSDNVRQLTSLEHDSTGFGDWVIAAKVNSYDADDLARTLFTKYPNRVWRMVLYGKVLWEGIGYTFKGVQS